MKIISSAFSDQQPIPVRYTGEGADFSPPLTFTDVPTGTKSLALIVDDPDAPNGTFDHWLVWNLPSDTKGLLEDAEVTMEGINHFGETRYRGPFPPRGPSHRYFFTLYALDVMLETSRGSSKEKLMQDMQSHILASAVLMGTYQR